MERYSIQDAKDILLKVANIHFTNVRCLESTPIAVFKVIGIIGYYNNNEFSFSIEKSKWNGLKTSLAEYLDDEFTQAKCYFTE